MGGSERKRGSLMYLLDTNICIFAMKNKFPALTEKLYATNPCDIYISSITVAELGYGSAKSRWGEKTKTTVETFLSAFTILPFTREDAACAGMIRAYLEKKGTPIGPYDCLIAAQGLARNLIVVTNNTKEFCRVEQLRTEDWTN